MADEGIFYLPVCEPCTMGDGSECHTPECAFWMHAVPKDGCNVVLSLDLSRRVVCGVRVPSDQADALRANIRADSAQRDEMIAELRAITARLSGALLAIAGPTDSGPWAGVYRNAGGGYEGLQAIARAALDEGPS